jgi:tellurite resistance protein
MSNPSQSSYTSEQTAVWIRGLVTLSWADGHFDPEEQAMITTLLHQDLSEIEKANALTRISSADLAAVLGQDPALAENFLRTAVMVALADGDYSTQEDEVLQSFCQALNLKPEALEVLRTTLKNLAELQPHPNAADPHSGDDPIAIAPPSTTMNTLLGAPGSDTLDVLNPVREWLDHMNVQDPKVAKMLCKMIPSQCPFERDISLFGRKLVHIPPMCKLNPLYEQFVGLRFRALSYLADDCGEDISEFV